VRNRPIPVESRFPDDKRSHLRRFVRRFTIDEVVSNQEAL
jgi:hypothetical protein